MENTLNLQKNEILDLSKKEPSLNNILLGTGWDITKKGLFGFKKDLDLDLVAILLNKDGKVIDDSSVVYYNNRNYEGISLIRDNENGLGEGDDEEIAISLNKLPEECYKIVFAAVIYEGEEKKQSFARVKNAYIRIVNRDNRGQEMCRYELKDYENGNTAITFAELLKEDDKWSFRTIGKFSKNSIDTLGQKYMKQGGIRYGN